MNMLEAFIFSLILYPIMFLLVMRHSKKFHNNCAFSDKSTKIDMCVKYCILKKCGY